MIKDKTETTNLPFLYPHLYEPIEPEEILMNNKEVLRHRIHCIAARTMLEIVADYEYRCDNVLDKPELLLNGIWMQNKYFSMLKEIPSARKRLKFFIRNNCILDPFPPEGMTKILSDKSVTGFDLYQVVLKQGKLPSKALDAVRKRFSLLDYMAVCHIAYYQALYEVLGRDKFNIIFRDNSPAPLSFGNLESFSNLLKKADSTPQEKDSRPVKVGSLVTFGNISQYKEKHRHLGKSQYLTVICTDGTLGKQKYAGLGLPHEGCSEEEIEELLVKEHNEALFTSEFITDELMEKIAKPKGLTGPALRNMYEMQKSFSEDPNLVGTFEELNEELHLNAWNEWMKAVKNNVTLDQAKKDPSFGYLPESHCQLNIDIIQEFIQHPLFTHNFPYLYTPMAPEEIVKNDKALLERRINYIAARHLLEIIFDHENRCTNGLKDPILLLKGIWLRNEYFSILKHSGCANTRLNYFKERNHIFNLLPPKGMEKIPSDTSVTGYDTNEVTIKKKALPSDVLDAARKGFSLLNSVAVCQIAIYKAICDIVGKDKFNMFFKHDGKIPLSLGNLQKSFKCLQIKADSTQRKENRPVKVGSLILFQNVKTYKQKHQILGGDPSLLVMCIDEMPHKRYIGYGLPSRGCTEEEIEDILVRKYNQPPFTCEFITDEAMEILAKRRGGTGAVLRERLNKERELFEQTAPLCRKGEDHYFNLLEDPFKEQLEQLKKITVDEARSDPNFGYFSRFHFQLNIDNIQAIMNFNPNFN